MATPEKPLDLEAAMGPPTGSSSAPSESGSALDDFLISRGIDPAAIDAAAAAAVDDAGWGESSSASASASASAHHHVDVEAEAVTLEAEEADAAKLEAEEADAARVEAEGEVRLDLAARMQSEASLSSREKADVEDRIEALEQLVRSSEGALDAEGEEDEHMPPAVASSLSFGQSYDESTFAEEDMVPIDTPAASAYDKLNRNLTNAGFEPLGDDPSPNALRATLASLLSQFERRGKTIQEMVLGHDVSREKSSRSERELARAQRELADVKSKLQKVRLERSNTLEDADARRRTDSANVAKLRRENAALKQRLAHSEHRTKAKEAVLQRMQKKLQGDVARRNAERERDRDLFRKIHGRGARPASPADGKAIALIGAFAAEKEKLTSELEFLRGEVQRLSSALRDKENLVARKDRADAWATPAAGELMERLSRSKREHDAARVALEEREAAVVRKLSQLERQLKAAVRGKNQAEDRAANLRLELASRPGAKAFRELQVRNAELERQVEAAVEALDRADARKRIEARAVALGNEAHDRRKLTDTRELIRRDRVNHRLGLGRLAALPNAASTEIIQACCRALELSNVELIVPAIEKMVETQREMPKLRQFVRDVRAITGAPNAAKAISSVKDIFAARAESSGLRALRASLAKLISASSNASDEQILETVGGLVELERTLMARKSTFAAVEAHMADHPGVVVSRIVSHFKQLFDVPSVEGVFPRMNALYVELSEVRNFLSIVRPMLGVAPSASLSSCAAAIQEAIDGTGYAATPGDPIAGDAPGSMGAQPSEIVLAARGENPEEESVAMYRENLLGTSQTGLPEWRPPVWD